MSLPARVARGVLHRSGASMATRSALSRVSPAASVATTNTSMALSPVRAQGMATASGGSLLTQLATKNPYKDVVRYEFKNRKWNLQHVDFYSDALAIGLLDSGLQPGDVVLSWLPAHFSESVGRILSESNGL